MNGASLNRCLEPGPKLQPDLVAVSLRFRRSRIGIRADIEKMYLQLTPLFFLTVDNEMAIKRSKSQPPRCIPVTTSEISY
ncbi:hypothetical protein T09_10027 [Trichinella sp. T9]|nr:hypothetical protein T09_10027 [Trichinella sp. T9]